MSLMKARWPPVSRSSAKSGSAAKAADADKTASAARKARSIRTPIMSAPASFLIARGRLNVGVADEFLDRHRVGPFALLAPLLGIATEVAPERGGIVLEVVFGDVAVADVAVNAERDAVEEIDQPVELFLELRRRRIGAGTVQRLLADLAIVEGEVLFGRFGAERIGVLGQQPGEPVLHGLRRLLILVLVPQLNQRQRTL